MFREIIAVCSKTHTKRINTLCEQNVKILIAKPGGTWNTSGLWVEVEFYSSLTEVLEGGED